MIVVNLFAGPGTGKSTSCAQIFAELKHQGINCEMVREFAKDKVWENSLNVLNDQLYVFGKQQHRLRVLNGQVDVVVTDSPILLSIIYDKTGNKNFKNLVVDVHNEFETINIFLVREKPYNPKGRVQDEEKAKILDNEIKKLLIELNIQFNTVRSEKESVSEITKLVQLALDAKTHQYHANS